MKGQLSIAILLALALTVLLVGAVSAQGPALPGSPPAPEWIPGSGPQPPHPDKPLPGTGPYRTPEGLWMMPEGARLPLEAATISPQATGGPDDYGYTWDDSVPLSWIDATTGTEGQEVAKIEQAMADLVELEEIILWRCPGSQVRLDALARRYEQEPLPKRGQRATPYARLKLLTMDLAADWSRLTLTERRRDGEQRRFIPATNNVSEQRIGLNIKERYRTMRGYKSAVSLVRVATLTAYLREEGDQALIRALAA